MKEASGELSMTAITVVAIGAIVVLFSTLVLPNLKAGISSNANCSQKFDCDSTQKKGSKQKCSYCKNEDCSDIGTVYCEVE